MRLLSEPLRFAASSDAGKDDQRRMFPRFQAHAEPGAALMFSSGTAEGDAMGDLARFSHRVAEEGI